ncbi:MAG: O-antigen ligase family protein [Clostridia bacterium]|nr:O-antigen ligase family protein [Clostridia bacterium]MCD8295032.1 O-antigen ligase family protein [Clostridia bacterium]
MAETEKGMGRKRPIALITLQHILNSRYLLFFSAAVVCLCYYLAWDIVCIYYLVLLFVLMLFFLRDLTIMLPHLAMIAIFVSVQNSTSSQTGASDYFTRPVIFVQIGILAILLAAALIFRFVMIGREHRFKPNGIFWGLCILSAAFLLNGAGSADYVWTNLLFGAAMAFCFLCFYVLFAGSIKVTEENFIKLCWGFVAMSMVLVIYEAVKYIQVFPNLKLYLKGEMTFDAFRENMVYGWGMWNTMGLWLNICIPAVFLLASKYRHGWALVLYATVLAGFTVLSCSRQALIGLVITYPLPAVVSMVKGKRWKVSLCIICAVVLAVAIFCLCNLSKVKDMLTDIFSTLTDEEGNYTGNGRFSLIVLAMDHFSEYPVFGSGWFLDFYGNGTQDTLNVALIPGMAHDTFAELLAACGMMGLLAYCLHRIQTIVEFVKSPSADKLILGMSIVALLIMSLMDNHIFYMLPTIVYAALLPFICTDKKEEMLPNPSVLPGELAHKEEGKAS